MKSITVVAAVAFSLVAAGCRSKREAVETRMESAVEEERVTVRRDTLSAGFRSADLSAKEGALLEVSFYPPDSAGRSAVRRIAMAGTRERRKGGSEAAAVSSTNRMAWDASERKGRGMSAREIRAESPWKMPVIFSVCAVLAVFITLTIRKKR